MAFELFVNGTLMRDLELHANMGNSQFLGEFQTAPYYRLHSINDVHPGMYRLEAGEPGGTSVRGELYLVEDEIWYRIEAGEPPYLYRGQVVLEDGREVYGILYPRQLALRYPDITEYGGWREYREATRSKAYSGES